MTGVIGQTIAVAGVVAYQDRENPEIFEYFPTTVPGVLGDSLINFSCQYYGIGAKAQWVQSGSGTYHNIVGGLVSGRARFDATALQRKLLSTAITEEFHIDNPVLRPIKVNDTSVQPVFAGGLVDIDLGERNTFPNRLFVGEQFDFSISSGNSLFPQLVASLNRNRDPVIALGLVVAGKLVLYSPPFVARVRADLSKVWQYVRSQTGLCASSGWYTLEGRLGEIVRGLLQEKILNVEIVSDGGKTVSEIEGLAAARTVFEVLNDRITAGPTLFRFSPRLDLNAGEENGQRAVFGAIAASAPWSVDINLTFPPDSFAEPKLFDEELPLQGLVTLEARSAMDLGVVCARQTKKMFFDVTLSRYECITNKKLRAFQARVAREVKARNTKIEEYERRLLAGKITLETYEKLVALLNNRTLSDRDPLDAQRPTDLLAEIEQIAKVPVRRPA